LPYIKYEPQNRRISIFAFSKISISVKLDARGQRLSSYDIEGLQGLCFAARHRSRVIFQAGRITILVRFAHDWNDGKLE
jgi:hypothetical protein